MRGVKGKRERGRRERAGGFPNGLGAWDDDGMRLGMHEGANINL